MIARALRLFREEGARSVWLHLVQWLGVYRRLMISAGVDRREGGTATIAADYDFLDADEIDAYLRLRPDQDPERVRRRLASGARCLVARKDGRLIATTWYARGRVCVEYLDCDLLLAPDAAFLGDTFVAPEFRGLRVADGLGAFRRSLLRAEGVRRIVGLFWPENRVATRRSRRLQDQRSGRLVRWQIGPWRRYVLRLYEGKSEPVVRLAPRRRRRSERRRWFARERHASSSPSRGG